MRPRPSSPRADLLNAFLYIAVLGGAVAALAAALHELRDGAPTALLTAMPPVETTGVAPPQSKPARVPLPRRAPAAQARNVSAAPVEPQPAAQPIPPLPDDLTPTFSNGARRSALARTRTRALEHRVTRAPSPAAAGLEPNPTPPSQRAALPAAIDRQMTGR